MGLMRFVHTYFEKLYWIASYNIFFLISLPYENEMK